MAHEYKRNGTTDRVPALIDAIATWVENWNDDPKPFQWHAAADEILTKSRGPVRPYPSQIRDAPLAGGGQALPPAPSRRDRS